MANIFTRMWKYLQAALSGKFNEMADPKIQLEQAILEAQDQHRKLKEQAANVIANQKQTEMKLDKSMGELEKLNANAQQALLMSEEARVAGDAAKATDYDRTAETIATKLIMVESEVEDLKALHLQSVKATEQAKNAVTQNSTMLQRKLADKQKLMSQLDQAKMSEQMNEAMSALQEQVGQDVPTFSEVEAKIQERLAKAQGRAELEGSTVEARMLEVEQAQRNVSAQQRLSELRSKLGIGEAVAETPADAVAETPTDAGEGQTATAGGEG